MKKSKKTNESTKIQKIKCAVCNRETPHYVNAKGEVRCSICQSIAKKIAVKTPKEVVFEMDKDFEAALNPVKVVKEVKTEKIEVPAEIGPEFDDNDLPL